MFYVDCSTKEDFSIPKIILDKVNKNLTRIYWKFTKDHPLGDRIMKSYPEKFADASIGCSTRIIPSISGIESNEKMVLVSRIGSGKTLEEAFESTKDALKIVHEPIWFEIPSIIGFAREKLEEIDEEKLKLHSL